jgi:hypothetical protein
MDPDPIYIRLGSFGLQGSSWEQQVHQLNVHIEHLHVLLGDDLKMALAGLKDSLHGDLSIQISFTGAFTGLSTLLHFCSFTRGTIALETGMETKADQALVRKLRELLVPIITSQCEILGTSMASHTPAQIRSIEEWYQKALVEVRAIRGFIGRLG